MINQFNSFTENSYKTILIIKTNENFENSIINKLEFFLIKN